MILANSPITLHKFNGKSFFLKRDDLLHPHFSGNKARKLMSLLATPSTDFKTLLSYGSAQSNAMYSLACLAHLKGWKFEYYVQHIPSWLKQNPIGNYRAALDLGMQITSMQEQGLALHPGQYITRIRGIKNHEFFMPEGGRASIAELGVKKLAQELTEWIEQNNIPSCSVALPSGTGTTALYLQKHLTSPDIEVLTCACVANSAYLIEQFNSLEKDHHPTILSLQPKHHFGQLYQAEYQIWQQLSAQTQVEFDLLYDPYMWLCLAPWIEKNEEKTLIYIHQGGLLGNESMLARYQREFG